jgi:excisionase family DNA binding protein
MHWTLLGLEPGRSHNALPVQNAELIERKLVNKREIARRYGVSERTIQEWMERGMIPFYKPGYMVRFDPIECDSALVRFRVPLGGHCLQAREAQAATGSDVTNQRQR